MSASGDGERRACVLRAQPLERSPSFANGEDFLLVCMAVHELAPKVGVDGMPPWFLEPAVNPCINAVDDRAQRFAPFAHYMHALGIMRA